MAGPPPRQPRRSSPRFMSRSRVVSRSCRLFNTHTRCLGPKLRNIFAACRDFCSIEAVDPILWVEITSGGTVDEVNTAVCINNTAELAHLETKCGVFKRLLHLSTLEEAEIAASSRRRAVAVGVLRVRRDVRGGSWSVWCQTSGWRLHRV